MRRSADPIRTETIAGETLGRIEMQRRFVCSGAFALLVAAAAATSIADWSSPAEAKPAANAKANKNANLKTDIQLSPNRLRWGLSLQQIAKIYDDEFDAQYRPIYKATDPGIESQSLDAEVGEKKALIRRTKIDFGTTPTGVDQGPLKGEYSYNNGESMARTMLAGGTQRFFFFFNDKLWKVYDEYKLGTKLGTSWQSAVAALSELFGGEPRMQPADPAHGHPFEEAIWTTTSMQIRAINRDYQKIVAVAYSDRSIADDLASHRPNGLGNANAIDSQVRDATAKDPEPAVAKPAKKKK